MRSTAEATLVPGTFCRTTQRQKRTHIEIAGLMHGSGCVCFMCSKRFGAGCETAHMACAQKISRTSFECSTNVFTRQHQSYWLHAGQNYKVTLPYTPTLSCWHTCASWKRVSSSGRGFFVATQCYVAMTQMHTRNPQ